jgi:hypothetical protein
VYLSLGTGQHVDEIRFSVLSADRFRTEDADWSIRVYTDRPELFADLRADLCTVTPETASSWSGPHAYVYRGKIMALADALGDPGITRAAIIDGDTYFTKSPTRLFSRIAPGRTVVHVREGRPRPPELAALRTVLTRHTPVDQGGVPWDIEETETLWNSGVIGLHRSDAGLCDEALHLNDQLLDHGFAERSHIAEMVGFGVVLARRSTISECRDVVTHYWPADRRDRFATRLRETWADPSSDPEAGFARLWDDRPRETVNQRIKFRIKRVAAMAGVELGRRS